MDSQGGVLKSKADKFARKFVNVPEIGIRSSVLNVEGHTQELMCSQYPRH